MKLKQLLSKDLTQEELRCLPTSFDTVGDIAIFNDFPQELKKKESLIAEKILNHLSHIKVIAKKTGQYTGEFRTPQIKVIAGEKRKSTLHKENGVRLKVHIEEVYFSSRTSTERERITKLVKKNENVLVMFSGICPLPIQISKQAKAKEIIAIEINPNAHKLAVENILLNKCKNIIPICGDVRKELPKLKKSFDRIILPLPKTAESFLDIALSKCKEKATINLYHFGSIEDIPKTKKRIRTFCKEKGFSCRFLRVVKAGQFSPGIFRLSFDMNVRKL